MIDAINEGVATSYIKKNKQQLSKVKKVLQSSVFRGNKEFVEQYRLEIINPLQYIDNKVEYIEKARYSLYIPVGISTELEWYSEGKFIYLGVDLKKRRILSLNDYGYGVGQSVHHMIVDALQNCDLSKSTKFREYLIKYIAPDDKKFETYMEGKYIPGNKELKDTSYNKEMAKCFWWSNTNWNLIKEYIAEVDKVVQSRVNVDKLNITMYNEDFPQLSNREFLPLLCIDTVENKGFAFDTDNPSSFRSNRLVLSDPHNSSKDPLEVAINNKRYIELPKLFIYTTALEV